MESCQFFLSWVMPLVWYLKSHRQTHIHLDFVLCCRSFIIFHLGLCCIWIYFYERWKVHMQSRFLGVGACWCLMILAPSVEKMIFSSFPLLLHRNLLMCFHGFTSRLSSLFHLSVCLYFGQHHICPDHCCFIVSLEVRLVSFLWLCSSPSMSCDLSESFVSLYKVWNHIVNIHKTTCWILIWIVLNL